MRKHPKYALAAALVVTLYLLYSFLAISENEEHARLVTDLDLPGANVVEDQPKLMTRAPKITIVAIWVPRNNEVAAYVPYFFQSVEANPEVDLLFVQVDKRNLGCRTYSSAPNVEVSTFRFSHKHY